MDSFELNIAGVTNLVDTDTNKLTGGFDLQEGPISEELDELALPIGDDELLKMAKKYENVYATYIGKVKPRQEINKAYLSGTQEKSSNGKTAPSNILFESTATFVPQALSKNPEPVVWSDNTEEGKKASADIKTMLQYHADVLLLRKKLGVMIWQWGVYFIAGVKHGWDMEIGDISLDVRKPRNFIFDPDGYVDEYGDFTSWLGEQVEVTAEKAIEMFPKHKAYISASVNDKLGTLISYTEWWNDDYCFITYKDVVLDKHKNEFFNYDGRPNHFARPKKPYTFLSIFSLQEQPHDFTNLIEQNIANQDNIIERDRQILKNLRHSNNALILDENHFNVETGREAAVAVETGDPILAPKGSVERLPANPLPTGILQAQEINKQTLRGIYGVQGLTAQQPNDNTTARGMILNQSFDSTRIGGGVGDALEQVADNIFNWWLQLYYVFYDTEHFASIMGSGRAVEYTSINMANTNRQYVVSVAPNSMKPKDELSQHNLAMERWKGGAIDPIGLMKEIDSPDPMEDAKRLVLWTTNPQQYLLTYFPESVPQPNSPNPANPLDTNTSIPPPPVGTLSQEPANASLSNVPLPA